MFNLTEYVLCKIGFSKSLARVLPYEKNKTDPTDAVIEFMKHSKPTRFGKVLFIGKITDLLRETVNGFTRGKLYLKRFIKEPFFALVTLGTFLFSGYIFTLDDTSENTHKLQRATRDALVAYIIALFAFFNLTLLKDLGEKIRNNLFF